MDLPAPALVNVLSRFPLKSIARFRTVSKEWRSLIDSDFFRDYYISFNASSSLSWSIIQTKPHKLSLEIIGHHGCNTWGLDRSPGSFLCFFAETAIKKLLVLSCTDGLVSVYAEARDGSPMYYIGNPLMQEWFQLPLPPFLSSRDLRRLRKKERFSDTGLVTKMRSGVVVSYKVVWMLTYHQLSDKLDFMIYSSETGTWRKQHVSCPHSTLWDRQDKSIALNGMLHWLSDDTLTFDDDDNDAGSVVSYDFYGDYSCRIMHFPGSKVTGDGKDVDALRRFRRSFTASEGSIVYFNEFRENETWTLRVWRLVKYENVPEAWQLFWDLKLTSLIESGIVDYFPVVMHPLNSDIIYLWNSTAKGLVLFNLRTGVFSVHKEAEGDDGKCMDGCSLSFNWCSQYMDSIHEFNLSRYQGGPNNLFFSHYVLPRWLHRLPRPQAT
ncbi:unnamed protein product [Eruca vesicaria subsp. sativa]|uniref:F-box domain-containing protein n=1 Tax=Eruca vesicaria subsp. sativa TaxID=29727 RepID=A0ABC8JX46_ERUVS|nr:unnamed protein product [Eruca vesicaria subsp. sativa]